MVALPCQMAKKMKIYKVKNNFYFYLVYIFLSLLVILCWTISTFIDFDYIFISCIIPFW